MTVETL